MHRLRHLLGPLRVFDAVYRLGGVTRAGRVLGITPGAVSQQIKQLETSLQVRLVHKVGREIQLTEAGQKLAPGIAEMFDRIEDCLREVTISPTPGQLRLKAMPTFAIRWLVPRLTGFYAQHGDIALEIETVGKRVESETLQADLTVRHGDGRWPGVHSDHIFDDEMIPVCGPQLAAKIRKREDILEVTHLHSIMRQDAWNIWLKSIGLPPGPHSSEFSLANLGLCIEAAIEEQGVAMAQKVYVRELLASGRLVTPVDHAVTTGLAYYLVCDIHRKDLPAIKAFRAWIRSKKS